MSRLYVKYLLLPFGSLLFELVQFLHKLLLRKNESSRIVDKLKEMLPTYKVPLINNKDLVQKARAGTSEILELDR